MKLKALAAGVLLATAGTASAAIDVTTNSATPDTAPSEFALAVVNATRDLSVTIDLGVDILDLPSAGPVDVSGTLNDVFGGTDDLSYSVVTAINNAPFGFFSKTLIPGVPAEQGIYTSSNPTARAVLQSRDFSETEIAATFSINANTFLDNTNLFIGTGSDNTGALVPGDAGFYDATNFAGSLGGQGFDTEGQIGEQLDLFKVVNTYANADAPAVPATELLGFVTLGADGAVEFAPVPVPAAVWLMGSALLGLVGIARRRAA